MGYKFYIKLYHEILHDRKMGVLSDRLWRRAIECFLLAGEVDNNGHLPPVDDIAWSLRVDIDQLANELNELFKIGILDSDQATGNYIVKKFSERQAPIPKKEFMRHKRETDKKGAYYQNNTDQLPDSYQNVTNGHIDKIRIEGVTNGNADKIRKEKIRIDKSETAAAVSSFHSHETQDITRIYFEITSQPAPPAQHIDTVFNDLGVALDLCNGDKDKVIKLGKEVFAEWSTTRSANTGKHYSKTNPAWITKLIEQLTPDPEYKKPEPEKTTTQEEDAIMDEMKKDGKTNDEIRTFIIQKRMADFAKEKSINK